jgi:two-component system phosphate regulon sensor histidine kinase PhoR
MNELESLRRENSVLRERLELAETDRQRMEALVRESPVGMLVIDAETRAIVLVNDEVERIIGIPNTLGSSLDLYHQITLYRRMDGREYAVEERPLARLLNGGEPARAEEILFVRPDGETVVVLINTTPIYSEDGRIESVVAVIQDMTPIEELDRTRSEFLGIVSHELRAPLTSIKGSAATVLGASVPFDAAEIRQFFRIIERQADLMRDLIGSLLDMTRIEAGTFSVTPEPVDLIYLLDDARNAFLRGGGRNPVEMDVALDIPPVSADRQRVVQTLNNLLSNASRHSDDSSTIRISAEPNEDSLFATISVADEGMGIAAARLPHIFSKFSGVEGGGERDDTGLGLASAKA